MRFKGSIIQPDPPPSDTDGELQLPDELAALGEQLRDDAARLAKVYPAEFYDRMLQSELVLTQAAACPNDDYVVPATQPRSAPNKWALVALASVLTLLIGAPLSVYLSVRHHEITPTVTSQTQSASEGSPADSSPPSIVTPSRPSQSGSRLMLGGASPGSSDPQAIFLRTVSGPELDAWLDVIEQTDPETTTLSM